MTFRQPIFHDFRGGQRNGRLDNNEGWSGMVQYMPGSRERSARHGGGGKGGRKAERGHIHSWKQAVEQLGSLALPSTMNVLRRTVHCEHTLRLQFSHLPPQKSGQLLFDEKQRTGVPNTHKKHNLARSHARRSGGRSSWRMEFLGVPGIARAIRSLAREVSQLNQDFGLVPHVAPTLSCACPSSTASVRQLEFQQQPVRHLHTPSCCEVSDGVDLHFCGCSCLCEVCAGVQEAA